MMDVAKEQVALCRSTVSGSIFEKIFFYLLIICSLVIFFLSAISLIIDAKDATITNVNFETRDTFDYPGMFFCYDKLMGNGNLQFKLGVEMEGRNKIYIDPILDLDESEHRMDEGKPIFAGDDLNCSEQGGYEVTYEGDFALKSQRCISWAQQTEREEEENAVLDDAQQRINDIAKYVRRATRYEDFRCGVFNQDGSVQASRSDQYHMFAIELSVMQPDEARLGFFVAGFFDQKLSPAEMFAENFRFYFIPLWNSITEVALNYDLIEDVSDETYLRPPAMGDNEEKQRKIYRGAISSAPFWLTEHYNYDNVPASIREWYMPDLPQNFDEVKRRLFLMEKFIKTKTLMPQPGIMRFTVESFIGRNMHIRKKSVVEVWSELGGCWASAALLITIFFINRSVVLPESGTTLNTQVLRFRTEHSKKEMLMQLKDYISENKDTVASAGDTIDAASSNV